MKSLILIFLVLGSVVDVKHPLSLSLSRRFITLSQPTLIARINILEDSRNREACLRWEGESELGSHCWTHDNVEDFPSHVEFPVRLHTLGSFEFQLSLRRTDRIVQTPSFPVEVH